MNAIQFNPIEIDAMSGGIKLELQWSKLKPTLTLVDVKSLSKDEFAGLKNQLRMSMIPKGNREEAANFILNLYNMGPGKYRNVNDLPYGFEWIDWFLPMIDEADRIQRLGKEVKKAVGAGSGLEFMGYHRSEEPVRRSESSFQSSRGQGRDSRQYEHQGYTKGPMTDYETQRRQSNGGSNQEVRDYETIRGRVDSPQGGF